MWYLVECFRKIQQYCIYLELPRAELTGNKTLYRSDKLDLARALGSEIVLVIAQYAVIEQVVNDVAVDYMFQDLSGNSGMYYWSVI